MRFYSVDWDLIVFIISLSSVLLLSGPACRFTSTGLGKFSGLPPIPLVGGGEEFCNTS